MPNFGDFESYVVRCGIKIMCLKELGLCAQNMMTILNLHKEHNGGGGYMTT